MGEQGRIIINLKVYGVTLRVPVITRKQTCICSLTEMHNVIMCTITTCLLSYTCILLTSDSVVQLNVHAFRKGRDDATVDL